MSNNIYINDSYLPYLNASQYTQIFFCLLYTSGKEAAVREQMEYKVSRQLRRIEEDDSCDKYREDWRQQMMRKFDRRE